MTNLIIEISKYFMIFMFAFYTYECFAAFRQKIKPEQREHILSRQCAAIFLIHFDAFAVIYLVTEDISILVFYAAQAVLMVLMISFMMLSSFLELWEVFALLTLCAHDTGKF